MTAVLAPTPSTTTTIEPTTVWKAGLAAGAVAAVATTAIAAAAGALDVPMTIDSSAIPLLAFAQLTLVFTVVGLGIASFIRRRASRPRTTWLRTTVALTTLSLVPDFTAAASTATKVALVLTHLVAAAIVIPVVARRLDS